VCIRNPKYIILFEDDVWAARNWYTRLMNQVHPLEQEWEQRKYELKYRQKQVSSKKADDDEQLLIKEEAQRAGGGPPRALDIRRERPEERDWAVVKLYMAEQYDQFDLYLNNDDIAFFVSWGVGWGLFAIAAYVAYLFFARWRHRGLVIPCYPTQQQALALTSWCAACTDEAVGGVRRPRRGRGGADSEGLANDHRQRLEHAVVSILYRQHRARRGALPRVCHQAELLRHQVSAAPPGGSYRFGLACDRCH
jgi:hypothetical protein